MPASRIVGVNERGLRIGQDHQRAKLTNREVELLLGLREQGWGYRRLAEKFEISKAHTRRICNGEARHQIPMTWRAVTV